MNNNDNYFCIPPRLTAIICRRIHGSIICYLTYPTLKRGATRRRSFAAYEHLLSASLGCNIITTSLPKISSQAPHPGLITFIPPEWTAS